MAFTANLGLENITLLRIASDDGRVARRRDSYLALADFRFTSALDGPVVVKFLRIAPFMIV